MAIASITEFFQEIARDLHNSLYVAIGGSIEEGTLDWSSKSVELVSTGIKNCSLNPALYMGGDQCHCHYESAEL